MHVEIVDTYLRTYIHVLIQHTCMLTNIYVHTYIAIKDQSEENLTKKC